MRLNIADIVVYTTFIVTMAGTVVVMKRMFGVDAVWSFVLGLPLGYSIMLGLSLLAALLTRRIDRGRD